MKSSFCPITGQNEPEKAPITAKCEAKTCVSDVKTISYFTMVAVAGTKQYNKTFSPSQKSLVCCLLHTWGTFSLTSLDSAGGELLNVVSKTQKYLLRKALFSFHHACLFTNQAEQCSNKYYQHFIRNIWKKGPKIHIHQNIPYTASFHDAWPSSVTVIICAQNSIYID